MKRISVVIPVVKWTEFALRSVKSALAANGPDSSLNRVDCIAIVNDAEDANKLLAEFPNHSLTVILRQFRNAAEGFNLALPNVCSEHVLKLGPENILLGDWFDVVAKAVAGNPGARMFYGAGFEVDHNDVPHKERNPRRPTIRNLCSRIAIVNDAIVYQKQLFEEFGGFKESFQWRSEFEFAVRLAKANVPMENLESRILGHRVPYVRRKATPEEMNTELLATNEAIDILKLHNLEAGNRWILHRSVIEADMEGHTRLSSISFDKFVLNAALSYRLKSDTTKLQKYSTALKLAFEHARIESNHLLKRPRLATRFLKSEKTKKPTFDRPSRRIFQLKYEEPKQLLIPSRYLTKRSSNSLSISIVTPNLNQGVFIERTLTSVLDQQYPKLEYVVQDGCSKDNSVEVIKRYESQISSWQSVKDHGQSHAINMGLERTSGDIMAYLNSDDILLPGSLDYVANYFEQHPEVDVVYGDRLLIDEEDRVINYWVLPEHDAGAIVWADFIPQETMFWRRSAWDAIGGKVDESFHFAMDWDMILRFRSQGKRFVHLPRFLGAFRITESQKTNQLQASVGQQDMNRLRKRELGYIPSDIEIARRMEHYVSKQKQAEQKHQFTSYITKCLNGMKAWEPSRSTPSTSCRLQAA